MARCCKGSIADSLSADMGSSPVCATKVHRVRYLKPYGELTRIFNQFQLPLALYSELNFSVLLRDYRSMGQTINKDMWLAANAPLTNKKAK